MTKNIWSINNLVSVTDNQMGDLYFLEHALCKHMYAFCFEPSVRIIGQRNRQSKRRRQANEDETERHVPLITSKKTNHQNFMMTPCSRVARAFYA